MKLHHLMDNKIGRAICGEFRLRHDACAADAGLADMAGKLDHLEVNANQPYGGGGAHESLTSPVSPYRDDGFINGNISGEEPMKGSGDRLDACGMVTEDSGISENSLCLTEELEAEKILDDITERDESIDDVTDSEESSASNGARVDRATGCIPHSRQEVMITSQCSAGERSRTIGQIRESLEQKVRRLRDEKAAVDEKIRLAQEEEDLRMREKTKLKQQLVVHRRDRLKKVIAELKRKLEDQSIRLQVTYSTLISLQRNIFRHRSFSHPKPLHAPRDSSLEAPF